MEGLVCEFLEAFAVEPVADDDGKEGTELSLEIDEPSQAEGQGYFGNHHVLILGVILVAVLFL